jgi:hypothetical protein
MPYIVLNPGNNKEKRTLIILGAARSMTSLLAGMLHCGGLNFGKNIAPIYEDIKLSRSMENKNEEAFNQNLADRNKDAIWGWKRPSIINHFDNVIPKLRNPHVIVIMRDVAAIAMRNQIARSGQMNAKEISSNMRINLHIQQKSLAKANEYKLPLCIVSAEKMKSTPIETAQGCASFFGIDTDTDSAKAFLEKGNAAYVASTVF